MWVVFACLVFAAAFAASGPGGAVVIAGLALFVAVCLQDHRLRQARAEIDRLRKLQPPDHSQRSASEPASSPEVRPAADPPLPHWLTSVQTRGSSKARR